MKKVLYLFLITFCLLFGMQNFGVAKASPLFVRVVFNQARVYNTADLSSVTTAEQLEQITIAKVCLHDVFEVLGEQDDFYLIEIEEQQGYIQKIAVIDNSQNSPEIYLQTNACVVTNATTYEKINNTYIAQNDIITQNTKVKLLNGYDKSQEYTFVSYERDGQIYSYYLKTTQVKPDGIDRSILLAVTLIVVALSAGGILLKLLKPKKNKCIK